VIKQVGGFCETRLAAASLNCDESSEPAHPRCAHCCSKNSAAMTDSLPETTQ